MRRTYPKSNHLSQRGFTLVEMLIIAPLVILLIGTIIAYITSLTGDSIKMNERSKVIYSTQEALTTIESTIKTGFNFSTTTGTLATPQGRDSLTAATAQGTGAFNSSNSSYPDALIVTVPATTASPVTSTRKPIYTDCTTTSTGLNPYLLTVVFFVQGTSLYKRTIDTNTSKCTTQWQRTSCAAGVTGTLCKAEDDKLADNVTGMSITYYDATTDPNTATNATGSDNVTLTADTASISLTLGETIAGNSISYTGGLRATLQNYTAPN